MSNAPNWTEVMSAWVSVATGVILILAAGAAWYQLSEARRLRHTQMTLDLSRRWDEDELLSARRDVSLFHSSADLRAELATLYKSKDEKYFRLLRVPNFMEDLAVMVFRGGIPIEVVRMSLGGVIINQWEFWKPSVAMLRKARGRDSIYENFERLAERIADR